MSKNKNDFRTKAAERDLQGTMSRGSNRVIRCFYKAEKKVSHGFLWGEQSENLKKLARSIFILAICSNRRQEVAAVQ